ncbi:surface antigen-domain-containing protein [Lipomyces arxii]|uniref:surface antigen-domain-containing protein n=1 Tax=Lipomyces arxii TaxID=56418 RepID=UPI0034D00655
MAEPAAIVDADAKRVRTIVYDALERNQSLPVVLTKLDVFGGHNTRDSFLKTHIEDLISKPYTMSSLMAALDYTTLKLDSFGIFSNISFALDHAENSSKAYPPGVAPLSAELHLQEAPSKKFRTGTEVGNGEVGGYLSGSLSNLFGGAESLTVDANINSLKQSTYAVNFSAPIKNSYLWKADITGVQTSSEKEWASHVQAQRGIRAKATGPGMFGGVQEIGYEAFWRTVTGIKNESSTTVRSEAGDTLKSSIFNTWQLDKRNDSAFPTEGYNLKIRNEAAGFVPNNKGDIKFMKGEVEGQVARSFFRDNFTISLTGRTGVLWSFLKDGKSNIVDRFVLGGSNDVRGFYLNRLGPSDEEDSVGGEAYATCGVSLFSKFPGLSKESPLRLHLFTNAGSLLALNRQNPRQTLKELVSQPSISAGVGVIYVHQVARFELNFTLPVAVRSTEFPRKGLQFGLGMSFL